MTTRAVYLRLGGSVLALVAGAAGVLVVVVLLRSEPGPAGSLPALAGAPSAPAVAPAAGGSIPTPDQPGFPAPPPGAFVLAREAGADALGLAIVPAAPRSLVRVSVVGPNGPGVAGLAVAVSFGGRPAVRLAPCGPGCYQDEVAAGDARRAVVQVGGRGYAFALLSGLAAPEATALVARAAAVWRSLKTLVWHERLASSPTEVIHTVYEAVAPDELSYTITGFSASVIIGGERWDRPTPTAAWVRSVQDPPLQVPIPFWFGVSDARLLGSARVGGESAWTVSFFDPVTPAWFEAEIDKRNGRTLELWMTAAAHFMHHLYGPFNAPLRLVPPVHDG